MGPFQDPKIDRFRGSKHPILGVLAVLPGFARADPKGPKHPKWQFDQNSDFEQKSEF